VCVVEVDEVYLLCVCIDLVCCELCRFVGVFDYVFVVVLV